MKARISLVASTLEIRFWGVEEKDRGRACSIELSLLHTYYRHQAFPWAWKDGKARFYYRRDRSTDTDYQDALRILRGRGLDVEEE